MTPTRSHNLERCEVMGTEGRFVLENLYQELTLYPRDSDELTVIRNSIMGGLSGFGATFTNRIHRWLEQVDAGVPRDEIEASGREGLAVQEIIEAAIRSVESRAKPKAVPASDAHAFGHTEQMKQGVASMLRVCVVGMGPIGRRHAKLYQRGPTGGPGRHL